MVSARKIIKKLTHAINLKILIAFSIQHLYECNRRFIFYVSYVYPNSIEYNVLKSFTPLVRSLIIIQKYMMHPVFKSKVTVELQIIYVYKNIKA